jgi:hypothetical protein
MQATCISMNLVTDCQLHDIGLLVHYQEHVPLLVHLIVHQAKAFLSDDLYLLQPQDRVGKGRR